MSSAAATSRKRPPVNGRRIARARHLDRCSSSHRANERANERELSWQGEVSGAQRRQGLAIALAAERPHRLGPSEIDPWPPTPCIAASFRAPLPAPRKETELRPVPRHSTTATSQVRNCANLVRGPPAAPGELKCYPRAPRRCPRRLCDTMCASLNSCRPCFVGVALRTQPDPNAREITAVMGRAHRRTRSAKAASMGPCMPPFRRQGEDSRRQMRTRRKNSIAQGKAHPKDNGKQMTCNFIGERWPHRLVDFFFG